MISVKQHIADEASAGTCTDSSALHKSVILQIVFELCSVYVAIIHKK